MKKLLWMILITSITSFAAEAPFNKGVNFTSWFQADNVQAIQFNKFTKQDFINAKSLGCDVVRLPINLHHMTGGSPNYAVDPLFYYFLDQVVDWVEDLDMHLILDNHTFSVVNDTDPNVGDILVPVWKQVAAHYKDRSTLIYYEVLNEPHGIDDDTWNSIQQRVVAAIREVDQKHTIIIGPAGWNSYNNLDKMPVYDDDNLIYTFHFYDTFLFTHKGAGWSNLDPLKDVPFPYDESRMPECPEELADTWVKGSLEYSYQTDGTVEKVQELIDIAANFGAARNVPLFCGEFGVYNRYADPNDRVYWYNVVRNYLDEKGIAWTIWDYKGGFGIFEKNSNEMFEHDLNIPLCEALGFTAPPQTEYEMQPDTAAFNLYMDFMGSGVENGSYSDGTLDFYHTLDPVSGQYCIHWTGATQYKNIGFNFRPQKDLSVLLQKGFALDFWVKGDTPETKFDLRFIDTKTGEDDHPWRMGMTVDESFAAWDGEWHHLQIPLQDLQEKGSWDNAWFNPEGLFDWTAIDKLEIVSEHSDFNGVNLWFDNIRIVDPQVTDVKSNHAPQSFTLEQNYPNPFNPITTITYRLTQRQHVTLHVSNIQGQRVATLVDTPSEMGTHHVYFDGSKLSSGLYFYTLAVGEKTKTRTMLLIR